MTTKYRKLSPEELADAIAKFTTIAYENPSVYYVVASAYTQAAEKATHGAPIDPDGNLSKVIDEVAKWFEDTLKLKVREEKGN